MEKYFKALLHGLGFLTLVYFVCPLVSVVFLSRSCSRCSPFDFISTARCDSVTVASELPLPQLPYCVLVVFLTFDLSIERRLACKSSGGKKWKEAIQNNSQHARNTYTRLCWVWQEKPRNDCHHWRTTCLTTSGCSQHSACFGSVKWIGKNVICDFFSQRIQSTHWNTDKELAIMFNMSTNLYIHTRIFTALVDLW